MRLRRRKISCWFFPYLIFIFSIPDFLLADTYRVNVTRKDSNFYKVTGSDIYIITKYCYEYVYYEDAILNMNGYVGKIIFLKSGESCDVRAVLGKVDIGRGDYKVDVTYEQDNLYSIFGTDLYIMTWLCIHICIIEEAILSIDSTGRGKLIFKNGQQCYVDGIYTKLNL